MSFQGFLLPVATLFFYIVEWPMQNLHKLKISPDLREKFEHVICQQVKDAVAGAADRDSMFVDYSNYVEGLSPIQTSARWNGASNMQWPLVLKALITVKSQLIQQVKRDPKATVAAIDPDDDKNAEAQEQFIVSKDHECGLTAALSEMTDPVCVYPLGIMHVGWKEEYQWKRIVEYQDTENGDVVPEELVDPEKDYSPIPRRERDKVYRGVELRCVDPYNWYIYPASDIDMQKSLGCGEAILASELQLLMGISTKEFPSLDYDHESVEKLIERGPCKLRDNEDAPMPDSELGTEFVGRESDAPYELFSWYCSAPIIRNEDGEVITPDYLIGEELRVVVCPAAEIMLYMGLSEYQKPRPYVPFYILPREGELYGRCLPQLLETLQTNVDVIAQEYTNSLQLATSPVFKVKKTAEPLNENAEFAPGFIFFYRDSPDEIMPMEVIPPNHANMEVIQAIGSVAEGLYAVSGIGQMDQKVRRAADIKNQQIQAQAKFDLFYFYFSGAGREGSGMIEVIRRMVSLYSENMPSDGEEYLDDADHKQKITPQQLKGRYIYRPVGSGNSADPETRQQHAIMVEQLVEKYWTLFMQSQGNPQLMNHLWAAVRQILISVDTHNIEELIGDQPSLPEHGQQGGQQQPMLPMMMQGPQNGQNGAGGGMAGMAAAFGQQ